MTYRFSLSAALIVAFLFPACAMQAADEYGFITANADHGQPDGPEREAARREFEEAYCPREPFNSTGASAVTYSRDDGRTNRRGELHQHFLREGCGRNYDQESRYDVFTYQFFPQPYDPGTTRAGVDGLIAQGVLGKRFRNRRMKWRESYGFRVTFEVQEVRRGAQSLRNAGHRHPVLWRLARGRLHNALFDPAISAEDIAYWLTRSLRRVRPRVANPDLELLTCVTTLDLTMTHGDHRNAGDFGFQGRRLTVNINNTELGSLSGGARTAFGVALGIALDAAEPAPNNELEVASDAVIRSSIAVGIMGAGVTLSALGSGVLAVIFNPTEMGDGTKYGHLPPDQLDAIQAEAAMNGVDLFGHRSWDHDDSGDSNDGPSPGPAPDGYGGDPAYGDADGR